MPLIVRCYSIFSIFGCDRLAIQPHGKVIFIGNGKIGRTVVSFVRFDAGNHRCFGICGLDIAAAAELFVRIGFPYAGMSMTDDLNIPRDTDSAVYNIAVVHIFKSHTVFKVIYEVLSDNGNLFELAVIEGEINIVFNRHISVRAARNDKLTALFSGNLAITYATHNFKRSA